MGAADANVLAAGAVAAAKETCRTLILETQELAKNLTKEEHKKTVAKFAENKYCACASMCCMQTCVSTLMRACLCVKAVSVSVCMYVVICVCLALNSSGMRKKNFNWGRAGNHFFVKFVHYVFGNS